MSEVFRAEDSRKLCHPEAKLMEFRSGSVRFNQSNLGRDFLIMLVRAEECDIALIVAACKEDVSTVGKHFDDTLLVHVLFSPVPPVGRKEHGVEGRWAVDIAHSS